MYTVGIAIPQENVERFNLEVEDLSLKGRVAPALAALVTSVEEQSELEDLTLGELIAVEKIISLTDEIERLLASA